MRILLNADLGEGEAPARTRALMRWIDLANVACGGHAGDERSMDRCARLAKEFDVKLGAHPGLRDRHGFGRALRTSSLETSEFRRLVEEQIETLEVHARRHGLKLYHVKLHGALYHMTDQDRRLAGAYARLMRQRWPSLRLVVRAQGATAACGRRMGLDICEEAFLDRAYLADGRLVPRGQPNALLGSWLEAKRQLRLLCERGIVRASDGSEVRLQPATVCLHGDSPSAAFWARLAARYLNPLRKTRAGRRGR